MKYEEHVKEGYIEEEITKDDFTPMEITDETTASEIIDYTINNNPKFKDAVKSSPKNDINRWDEIFDF